MAIPAPGWVRVVLLLEVGLAIASIGFVVLKQLPVERAVGTGAVGVALLGAWRHARVHGERACLFAAGLLCAVFVLLATQHRDGFVAGILAGAQLKLLMIVPLLWAVREIRANARKLSRRDGLDDVFR